MRLVAISVITAVLALGMVGCKTATGSKVGAVIPTDAQIVPAKSILDNPATYEGKQVVVTGKITSECPSGCWFWVKDASGEIYVDINPSNLFIPQRVGRTVKVTGTVVLEQGRPQVVGTGLEF